MTIAAPLVLRDGDEQRLAAMVRSQTVTAAAAKRARIVLLAADGVPNAEIARRVGVSRPTVVGWRQRYTEAGMKGAGRSGPAGPAGGDRRRRRCGGDVDQAAGVVGGVALVGP